MTTPPMDAGAETKAPKLRKRRFAFRGRHATLATFATLGAVIVVMFAMGRFDSVAQNILERLREPAQPTDLAAAAAEPVAAPSAPLVFTEMDIHPDVLFRPYMDGPMLVEGKGEDQARMIQQFRDLLGIYVQRQGVDDNFTIRLLDARDNSVLEVFELTEHRARYEERGTANWGAIDDIRRRETTRLVQKWSSRVPREHVMVRWGRANQIHESRERDIPFIEHELNLARTLGLSLLATEVATVETFNQDRLVSSVGARSRYQMMPYILRRNGVHHYSLRSAAGNTVQVFEEWHPLLTLEPAFITLKGYINSVGHEIPGISAYHTGPGNIYMVFRTFLENTSSFNESTTVADAYLWAVTEGFDRVSSGTSFKTYSRGYVPSAYGALKATEDVPIDTTQTILTERVQIAPGEQIFLSDLIEVLENDAAFMRRNRQISEQLGMPRYLYNQVKELNPHIQLPAFTPEAGIPPAGDLRLVARVDNVPVRFFLPLGATDALERAGLNVIDRENMFVFDRNAYTRRANEVTIYDRQYDELVASIGQFGFTNANRAQLLRLRTRFEELYRENPSHFRRLQLEVIRVHAQIWQSGPWDRLAAMVSAQNVQRVASQPPAQLGSGMAR